MVRIRRVCGIWNCGESPAGKRSRLGIEQGLAGCIDAVVYPCPGCSVERGWRVVLPAWLGWPCESFCLGLGRLLSEYLLPTWGFPPVCVYVLVSGLRCLYARLRFVQVVQCLEDGRCYTWELALQDWHGISP